MDAVSRALLEGVPLPVSLLSELGQCSLRQALLDASPDQDVACMLSLWPKLVQTASSPRVNDKHITAASNAVCVYLSCAGASPFTEFSQFVLSEEVWFQAFHCAQKAFDDGKAKPAFQIMEILCDLLQKLTNPNLVAHILEKASLPLVRIILLASPRSDIKKACLLLSCFHRKTPLIQYLDQTVTRSVRENHHAWKLRLSEHNIALADVSTSEEESTIHLFLALIFAMVDLDTRSAALKLCSVFNNDAMVAAAAATDVERLVEQVVRLYFDRNHSAMGTVGENVLPVILHTKGKLISFVQPYASSCRKNASKMALFIAILKVGRLKAILSESEVLDVLNAALKSDPTSNRQGNRLYWCKQLMMIPNSEVQILIYGLLVSSPAGNAVVSSAVLDCIASSMRYLHDHSGAHQRGEILSITKRLLKRLHDSARAIRKSANGAENDGRIIRTTESYTCFTKSFYNFLKDELNTGVSYPRHILSLLSLQHLINLGDEQGLLVNDKELVELLISLVLDPFEDVRSSATTMLRTIASRNKRLIANALSCSLSYKVEALTVKTGRADHADAMGRLFALRNSILLASDEASQDAGSYCLVENISRLKHVTQAQAGVQLKPGCPVAIHGELLSVSYQLQFINDRDNHVLHLESMLVEVCSNVWDQVRVQLCVDSPETSSVVEKESDNEGPKDLLAFSWRALRDSSIVLQSLIAVTRPSRELFHAVGELCMDQLISLRHRGAFSTVAQTFNQCCEKIRLSADVAVRGLIQHWYQVALVQIDEQSDRLTRRSAGLPAMITALLSPVDTKLFSTAITDLMALAQRSTHGTSVHKAGETKLPQVHALNCLKDIMTNSRFSVVVAQYLGPILTLAANCLSSKTWATRNCGLMLLRACINRFDDSITPQMMDQEDQPRRLGNGKGPTAIAFRLLKESIHHPDDLHRDSGTPEEHIFAGLDLLAHATPVEAEDNEARRLVTYHLSHPTWAVRNQAAILLATPTPGSLGNPVTAIHELLEDRSLQDSVNTWHGRLLCCRYLLKAARDTLTRTEIESIFTALDRELYRLESCMVVHSPYTDSAWLDLLNDAASIILDHGWNSAAPHLDLVRLHLSNKYASTVWSDLAYDAYVLPKLMLLGIYDVLVREGDLEHASEQMTASLNRAAEAPDALRHALEVLRRDTRLKPSRAFAVFLVGLLRQAHEALPPDLLEQACICLTRCLGQGVDILPEMLQVLLDTIDFSQLHTPRHLRNAVVELQGALLGKMHMAVQDLGHRQKQLGQWLQAAQDCAADEVDFPTRLSAARAVSSYLGPMRYPGFCVEAPATRMRLLLLLYDFLNDDAEDVRLEAVAATRKLKLQKMSAMENLSHCALAARGEILHELQHQFGRTQELAEAALRNLLRIGHNVDGYDGQAGLTFLLNTSTASKLLSISRAKNDLFVEEKQNLYIDDIREIRAWTEVLHESCLASVGPQTLEAVSKWTLDGLVQVTELLETNRMNTVEHAALPERNTRNKEDTIQGGFEDHGQLLGLLLGHPLGVTYDHDILVVMLQTVSLAGLLCRHQEAIPLKENLESVMRICSESRLNPVLLCAAEHALRDE